MIHDTARLSFLQLTEHVLEMFPESLLAAFLEDLHEFLEEFPIANPWESLLDILLKRFLTQYRSPKNSLRVVLGHFVQKSID